MPGTPSASCSHSPVLIYDVLLGVLSQSMAKAPASCLPGYFLVPMLVTSLCPTLQAQLTSRINAQINLTAFDVMFYDMAKSNVTWLITAQSNKRKSFII